MTKKQREQVVELLRCTADECQRERNAGLYGTATQLGLHETAAGHMVRRIAIRARTDVDRDGGWPPYEDACLEAAARVEEGWTP